MTQLPVLILAGGLGTRLGEKTKNIPKALVAIAGQPFLFWKLKELSSQGVSEVHILTGHLGHEINEFLSTTNFPMRIEIHDDGEFQLGTAGAIYQSLGDIDCSHFLLTYGDNLLQQQIANFTIDQSKFPIIVTTRNIHQRDSANIDVKDGIVNEYSKRNNAFEFMDYGYAVFQKDSFLEFELNKSGDLANYIQFLASHQKLNSFETQKDYFEIGTPESFLETEKWLLANLKV